MKNATLFLQGKTTEVLDHLQRQMDEAAEALAFERAAQGSRQDHAPAAAAIAPVRRKRDRRRHRRRRRGRRAGPDGGQRGDDPRRAPRRRPDAVSGACRRRAAGRDQRRFPDAALSRAAARRRRSLPRASTDDVLAEVLSAQAARKVQPGRQSGRRAARVGDDGKRECAAGHPARSSRRRRPRTSALPRCRKRWACRRRRSGSNASTSAIRWARRRWRAASFSIGAPCRRASTDASTSRRRPAATITPRCARR